MLPMASFSQQSSPRKPKLERRNAMKIPDYEPSDSPRLTTFSRFRAVDRDPSNSFRVTGVDSQSEIDRICEQLGISGGADAFGITEAAWEAGKARSTSLDRFTRDLKVRSKSLDEQPASFFDSRGSGSSVQEVRSLSLNSISSSSTDSYSSDISDPAGEKMLFEPVVMSKDKVPFCHGSNVGLFVARQQEDDGPSHDRERVSRDIRQLSCTTVEVKQQTLLPPPPIHVTLPFRMPSTHELVVSFGPDEYRNDGNNQARPSDHNDTSQNDSKGNQAAVLKEKSREELAFVSQVVQRHGVSAKEHTLSPTRERGGKTTPVTLEHDASIVSIQSWRKLDMLGSGSFGTVYEGMSEDGIYFAVKEVSLSENDSKAQQCVLQLEQEIKVFSKLNHENIVRYLGTQKEPDKLYIFLELVTKGSLASLYQKYDLFDSQIRLYTRQILSGLKYLHDQKIVHRDIKCANILVDASGKIKLADFGLSRQISQFDELKSCKGSAYWMAPEVIDPRKTYSFPADIWSLGCTVLEMETRHPPFGDMEWHRALWKVGHGEAPPIPETLSEGAKDFIKRCLEVNPAKRPTAGQLLEHPFVQYVGGMGLTPRNSFSQETSELQTIVEEKSFDG